MATYRSGVYCDHGNAERSDLLYPSPVLPKYLVSFLEATVQQSLSPAPLQEHLGLNGRQVGGSDPRNRSVGVRLGSQAGNIGNIGIICSPGSGWQFALPPNFIQRIPWYVVTMSFIELTMTL
jgi:hypothetical protein